MPHVLAVDDSEAILEYERAVLGAEFQITTTTDGSMALRLARELRPDVVLLDVSMPVMTGEQVLDALRKDPQLKRTRVAMVTSEVGRGAACLGRGASAVLGKPIRAEELQALVRRLLEEARVEAATDSLAVLLFSVGELRLGVPLDCVERAILYSMPRPLFGGPAHLGTYVELAGRPIPILDLGTLLDAPYHADVVDRRLLVVRVDGRALALSVDALRDPVEYAAGDVTRVTDLAGGDAAPLKDTLVALVKDDEWGRVSVVEPRALAGISADEIRALVERARAP
jgi:CheY-like chemotaxis protein/chemotaxis signal transduction protein